jgi:hypothetical protein
MTKQFPTIDALVDHVAQAMHAANLECGGVFAGDDPGDVEKCIAEGYEIGADGRISSLAQERSYIESQVQHLSKYDFLANGCRGPESSRGLVRADAIYYALT